MYPFYEKSLKAGINTICIHKGLMPPDYEQSFRGLWEYATAWDIGKAAQDWPEMNFVIYHSALRPFLELPDQAWAEFEATGESYVMAARLQGDVASAFPDGPPEGFRAGDDAGQWLSESAAPINVIVVGDTDMLADGAWVQLQQFLGQSYAVPMADNGTFVSNALDVLAGSNELIGLRSRGTGVREFEVVEALKLKAEAKYRETEQALQAKLSETENKLAELQTSEASGAPVLSAEQEVAIEAFRRDMVATRKQLRDVRHDLQKDIEGLGTWLKVINIGAVPLVIAVIAVLMAPLRRRRRQRALN